MKTKTMQIGIIGITGRVEIGLFNDWVITKRLERINVTKHKNSFNELNSEYEK